MNSTSHPRIRWWFAIALSTVSLVHAADRDRKPRGGSNNAVPEVGTPPAANSLESFQIIAERNIFNPSRVGRTRTTVPEKPPRVDEISLVGTMEYHGGVVAFFDSPDAAFRKNVREGESIGDFTVRRIAPDGVDLAGADKSLTLKVAQQLRRAEGGDWNVITMVPPPPPAAPGSPADMENKRAAASAAANEIPADASEVLRRLLKKREKQLLK